MSDEVEVATSASEKDDSSDGMSQECTSFGSELQLYSCCSTQKTQQPMSCGSQSSISTVAAEDMTNNLSFYECKSTQDSDIMDHDGSIIDARSTENELENLIPDNEGEGPLNKGDNQDEVSLARMNSVARDILKFNELRADQVPIIRSLIGNKDSIIIKPTGFGKFYVVIMAAILTKRTFIITTPLTAIMTEQHEKLQSLGVRCALVNCRTTEGQMKCIRKDIMSPEAELLVIFTTPEACSEQGKMQSIFALISSGDSTVHCIVVDESQCLSFWGGNFRPAFMELRRMREKCPSVKISALSASICDAEIPTLVTSLNMREPEIFRAPLVRTNIKISFVHKTGAHEQSIADHVGDKCSTSYGIIFHNYIARGQILDTMLRNKNIESELYFSGLDDDVKCDLLDKWKNGFIRYMNASIALLMGMDIEFMTDMYFNGSPESVEFLIQGMGRVARDGLSKGSCNVYFNFFMFIKHYTLMENDRGKAPAYAQYKIDKFKQVFNILMNRTECRRYLLSQYLHPNEENGICELESDVKCDYCEYKQQVESYDATPIVLGLLKHIAINYHGTCEAYKLISSYKLSCNGNYPKLNESIALKDEDIEYVVTKIITADYIELNFARLNESAYPVAFCKVSDNGRKIIESSGSLSNIVLPLRVEMSASDTEMSEHVNVKSNDNNKRKWLPEDDDQDNEHGMVVKKTRLT